MRILFLAPRLHSNQYSLVKKLVEENHDVAFFVMSIGNSEDHSIVKPRSIELSSLNQFIIGRRIQNIDIALFANQAIPSFRRFYKMINEYNPDAIVVRGGSTPIYSWMLFPYLFSRRKIIYYTQGPKFVNRLSTLRKIHDFIVARIFKIKWYTPVLNKGHISLNPINLDYIRYVPFFMYPKVTSPIFLPIGTKLKILCVAKYEARKNIMVLLDTIEEIARSNRQLLLTIVGSTGTVEREAYYEEVQSRILELNLNDVVEAIRDVPFKEMEEIYRSNHLFVMPSSNEPASVSQLEAMAYGLPVICSEDNGTAHYISHGKNGYIVKPTVFDLRIAISSYLNNSQLVNVHSRASLEKINSEFSIENCYVQFITLIDNYAAH